MANSSLPPYHPTSKPSKPICGTSFSCKSTNLFSLVVFLCIISYFLGIWQHGGSTVPIKDIAATAAANTSCNIATNNNTKLDFNAHHSLDGAGPTSRKTYPPCNARYSEYTPCEDANRSLRFSRDRLIYRERHCPEKSELLKCRVPAPYGYQNPFAWPASRDLAWYANVPHKELTIEKAVQNWIRYDGDKFKFPGGGTMFPNGADAYIDDIGRLINLQDGSIRTAIDTGCGVSFLFFIFYFLTCFYLFFN
jgi:hypothetical protein